MSSLYDDLKTGLEQAIDYEKGKGKAIRKTYVITPVKTYSAEEVKHVREAAGMTQASFAACMGVTKKAVEAWECGRSTPSGTARRLMELISGNVELPFLRRTM